MSADQNDCRIAVDIGGTFTDVVIETSSRRHSTKVLTTHHAPDDGAMTGIDRVLNAAGREPANIDMVLHGTTLATNALIVRKGAKTAFLTTKGMRDVLEMGFEKRFAPYNLDARRPPPLIPRVRRHTVSERMTADGTVREPLDVAEVHAAAAQMREDGIEAVAVGFMHAYAHPAHEEIAADILTDALPGATICLSSAVCPELREYERFSTTAANAYVRPLMAGYLNRLQSRLSERGFRCPTFLMMSGGGLTTLDQAARFPIRLVESGPAGGAILAAHVAAERELSNVMAFDMGGTTAKICLIDDGTPERARVFEIARAFRDMKGSGLPVRIPVIDMVEIGAGGGSIARVDAMRRIAVGPDSAGSDPGPVAYGSGGANPTVTDANLCLGKLSVDGFAGGRITLDQQAAEAAITREIADPLALDCNWGAAGIVEIVEENMANAARVHAIERGKDPSEYTMIAFGGGAPLHAAKLADKLGIDQIVIPQGAGVGSAIGFLRAPISYQVVRSARCLIGSSELGSLNTLLAQMRAEAETVVKQGAGANPIAFHQTVDIRYVGQGHELTVPLQAAEVTKADMTDLRRSFETLYDQVYGLTMPDAAVECVSWSITAQTPDPAVTPLTEPVACAAPDTEITRQVFEAGPGTEIAYSVFGREALVPGTEYDGPAIIAEDETSTVVPPGFSVRVDSGDALRLNRRPSP